MSSPVPPASRCEHVAKATGWGGLSAITALAIPVIAAALLAVSAGLPIWDGFFLHRWVSVAPINLIWGIPVTIAFFALDVAVIVWLGQGALRLIKEAYSTTVQATQEAREHFCLARDPTTSRS